MKKSGFTILLTAALLTACGKSGSSMEHSMTGSMSGSHDNVKHSEMSEMNHGSGHMDMETDAHDYR